MKIIDKWKEERGETNIVPILIIIILVFAIVFLFREYIEWFIELIISCFKNT